MTNETMKRRRQSKTMITMLLLMAILISGMLSAATERVYAADGTIKLSVGRVIDYSSHFTHYFYAGDKDNPVYCAQPQLYAPEAGTYSYNFISADSMLAKCLYYGYGGPGYSEYTDKKLSGQWDGDDDAYVLTHLIISIAYDKTTSASVDPFDGLNSTWKAKAKSLYEYVKSLPDVPANYRAFRIQNSGRQDILGSFNDVGGIKLQKTSTDSAKSDDNNKYSLSGAKYGVYYNDKLCYTMTTDSKGAATLDNVLVADYVIKEIDASKGFAVDTAAHNCSVKNESTTSVSVTEVPKSNPVDLLLQKGDKETGKAEAQGGATLEGAVYEIKYYKGGASDADRVWRVVTNDDGEAALADEFLDKTFDNSEFYLNSEGKVCFPLGKVTIQEVKAPEGYLLNDDIYTSEISEGSETTETVSTFNEAIIGEAAEVAEQIKRGDIQLVKVKDGTMTRLANVQFRITSKTTGESHVVCTDENGMIDTQSSFNPHSQDTNGGDADSGLWFGDESALDDEKGALLYDYYYLNELRSDANTGLKLAKDIEFRVYKNNAVINLGTVTDDVIKIGTTALDSDTKNHISLADNKVTIIDTVKYENFTKGNKYKLVGTLMDKATGKALEVNGRTITSEKEFTAKAEDGTETVEFTFDASALGGTSVVVFEKAYDAETNLEVCSHEDITDEGQTVYIPKIGTKATASDGKTNVISAAKGQKITDTVKYENLIPGKEYELKTWLTKDGHKILGTTTTNKFTPTEAKGEVKVTLTFDASRYGGKSITVFEEVSLNGKLVAEHKDKDDKDQTITVKAPTGSPKTGDNAPIYIVVLIMILAAGTQTAVMIYRRKKELKNDDE